MQIPVLVEQVAGNGVRARSGEPLVLVAEAATQEEALGKLRAMIADRLAAGAALVALDVASSEHPLAKYAGVFKDDPYFEEWQQAIAEYRRQVDADPNAL